MPPLRPTIPEVSSYPVIVACVGEGRRPSLAEIRRVIRRLRREAFPGRRIDGALRRQISLAALAALGALD
jgi:hypothetical protein